MPGPIRLTKKLIDALPDAAEQGRAYIVRDTGVRGLLLSINKDTTKTWKVQRDLYRDGKLIKTVRTTIRLNSWSFIANGRGRHVFITPPAKRIQRLRPSFMLAPILTGTGD